MLAMKEVPKQVYEQSFQAIFDWFQRNAHAVPDDEYTYKLIHLSGTHLKMVDIIRDRTDGVYFRVVLKATYDSVKGIETPKKNFRDINYLFNTKSDPAATHITGTQVCFIQLNDDNQPVDGILFTYAAHDESFHRFPLS